MINKLLDDSRFHIALLILIPLLVYSQIISFSFTGSDDKTIISNLNALIASGKSAVSVINAPYMFDTGLFYRPLVTASFYITILLTKSLYIHFLLNILFLITSVLILYYILSALQLNRVIAFFLALVFAVNPVLVNSVAWLPGRNDSLLAVFILASFLALINYIRKNSYRDLVLHLIFLLAAFFSKETALLAIPVFGLYWFFFKSKLKNAGKPEYLLFLAWLFAALVWFFFRNSVIKEQADFEYIKNIPYIVQGLGKIILPVNLSVLPVLNDTSYIYGLISIVILSTMYFYTPKEKRKLYLFGMVFSVIFLIPAIINKNTEYTADIMLESRLFLPAVGVLFSLSQVEFLNIKSRVPAATVIALLFITAMFSYRTIGYSKNYSNELYFWNNAVETSPSLDLTYSGLGLYNLQNENFENAISNYKKASELNPSKGEYFLKIAYCYNMLNNIDGAEEYYRKALNIYPGDHDANLILGIICYKKKNYSDAEKYLTKASASNIKDLQPELYLLRLYYDTGMLMKAKTIADKLKDNNVKLPAEIEKKLYQF